jgi:hypothetical protein
MWIVAALVLLLLVSETVLALTGDFRRDAPTTDVDEYLRSRAEHPAGKRAAQRGTAHRESA